MVSKRPHINAKTMVNVAINQACSGAIICGICKAPMNSKYKRILEHLVPHELGGSSDEENLRWVHEECALKKTNGNKATVVGGDIHKIAKAKRLAKAQETHAAIVAKVEERKPSRIPSRPFPKQQRGFR